MVGGDKVVRQEEGLAGNECDHFLLLWMEQEAVVSDCLRRQVRSVALASGCVVLGKVGRLVSGC